MTTNTTRNSKTRDLAALRAEVKELKEQLALHEECLEIAAEAIKTLQQKELKKASAPKEQGRPWNKLTKDEKHRLNAYAYRHLEEVGGSWEAWEAKRTTIMFR